MYEKVSTIIERDEATYPLFYQEISLMFLKISLVYSNYRIIYGY